MKNPKLIESKSETAARLTRETAAKYGQTIALFIALLIGFLLGRI